MILISILALPVQQLTFLSHFPKKILLNINLAFQLHHFLAALADESPTDHIHLVDQDQISDLLVSCYDCRKCLKVGRFLDRFEIVVQLHMVVPTIVYVLIFLFELRQPLSELTIVHSHIEKQLNSWRQH